MPDFVRLINEDYRPFDFQQKNVKRIIQPGGEALVPWDIAVTLFGHPRLVNVPPANERTKAYEKIRARHNFSSGLQTEDEWEATRPHVRVIDLDGDTEIIMLIDDPDGTKQPDAAPQRDPQVNDMASLQQQIAFLTAQVTKMAQMQQAQQAPAAPGTTSSPTATADSAGQAPASDAFSIQQPTGTAGPDNPQATPVAASTPAAGDDMPPAAPRKAAARPATPASR